MKKYFLTSSLPLFLILSVWFLLCSQTPVPYTKWIAPPYTDTLRNPVRGNEALLKDGKKIYESVCWTCHGLKGKGDGPASAALNPKPSDHTSHNVQQETDGSIFWKISNGRGNMQPFGKIYTAKQRWALVNYIRVLGKYNENKGTSSIQ